MPVQIVEQPDKVRYPLGDFGIDPDVTASKRQQWLREMEEMPKHLAAAVRGLDDTQLGTPYREGGWMPRQVRRAVPAGRHASGSDSGPRDGGVPGRLPISREAWRRHVAG